MIKEYGWQVLSAWVGSLGGAFYFAYRLFERQVATQRAELDRYKDQVQATEKRADRLAGELASVKSESKIRIDETMRDLERTIGELEKQRVLHAKGAEAVSSPELTGLFARVTPESQADLLNRIKNATKRIRIYGLTRNFYAADDVRELLVRKAAQIPIKIFIVDPDCASRTDRYRIEPIDAALEDPRRYKERIEPIFLEMLAECSESSPLSDKPGLSFYYYNFPCPVSIDEFDDQCRVSEYGINKQGRESPIFVWRKSETPRIYAYYVSQLDYVERLASDEAFGRSNSRGLQVRKLQRSNAQTSSHAR